MNRRFLGFAVAASALLAACAEAEPRTQLMFELEAPGLEDRIGKLEVRTSSDQGGDYAEFRAGELDWPVQIVVIPSGSNRARHAVTLTASAYDSSDTKIAEWQRTQPFTPQKQLKVAVAPSTVGPGPGGGPSNPDGGAPRDAEVEPLDGPRPEERDGGPGEPRDAGPSSQEAGPGRVTCATEGSGIECDDGNACNGRERCDPTSAAADERGCLKGDNPVTCAGNMTCDRATGRCSACTATPDGDGDGARSMACGGDDCNDSDQAIAPGATERCDGKDNNCDGTVDGTAANGDCASTAPTGGSAVCESSRCVQRCTDPSHQIENGACVAPSGTCPIPNPCAPGTCVPGRPGSYSCMCPAGYRAGLSRCMPIGSRRRTIGFDTTCDGMATPGMATGELKQVPGNLYAACGVAALTTTPALSQVQLFEPSTTMVEGITGRAALAGFSAANATSELSIALSPGVNEVAFDLLDIDNAVGLRVLFEAANGADLMETRPELAAPSKRAAVRYRSMTPIERVTISYAPLLETDAWYLDELALDIWGCGDGELEMVAGEACDDGNAVQCDGCDNACSASASGCLDGASCLAAGAMSGCLICDMGPRADAGADVPPRRDPLGGIGCR